MNSKSLFGLASVIVAMLGGCSNDEGVQGNAEVRSEARTVEQFVRVENRGSYDVLVRPGTDFSVTVRIDANLFDRVTATVENGTLILGESERLDPALEEPHVIVTLPALEQVIASAEGDVDVSYFEHQAPVRLTSTGDGDIDFDGKAALVTVECTGTGGVDLRGQTDVVELTAAATCDVDVEDLIAGEVRRQ